MFDDVVHGHRTHAIGRAMKAHGKSIEVILFDDEDHGFYRQDDYVEAHEAMLPSVREHRDPASHAESMTR